MPKGHTKYTKYETALLKAAKQIRKATARIERAAAELEARPDPVIAKKAEAPKPAKARQLKLPGVTKRKAAKRAQRSSKRRS